MKHIANPSWTFLPPLPQSLGLAPFGFHLFRTMEDSLHGQYFFAIGAITAAVKQWITPTDANVYDQALAYHC